MFDADADGSVFDGVEGSDDPPAGAHTGRVCRVATAAVDPAAARASDRGKASAAPGVNGTTGDGRDAAARALAPTPDTVRGR